MKEKQVAFLLGLDELFDTRLGTIARIDPKKAAELLHGPYYSSRPWDLFPGVDDKVFKELYAARDRETLRLSQSTPAIGILRDFVKRSAKTALENPVALVPVIHLNVHPYRLTEAEINIIVGSLRKLIPLLPEIKVVDYSMEELNPLFCRMSFNTMLMYNAHEWLEKYSKNKLLEQHRCESVTLFAPVIIDKPPPSLEVPKNFQEQYYSMSIFAQLFVNLTYVGVDNFCSFLSRKPDINETTEEELAEIKDSLQNPPSAQDEESQSSSGQTP